MDGRCALRGTVFLLVQKDGEERARQGEGLFTKPPFSLDPHPPKLVTDARLTNARVRDASLRSTRAGPCGWECRGNDSRCPICHSEEHSDEESRTYCVQICFGREMRPAGTVFLLVQKDGEERARQGEGLFTKPPFSLDPHPPKLVIDARLADARARRLAPLDARRAVRKGMSGERFPLPHLSF